jgi:hypothetical protein
MQADNGTASNSASAQLRTLDAFRVELSMVDLWR